jgi:integrase
MNRGAYLLGKAVDVAARAPWSPKTVLQADPKEGIAAGRLYKVLKAFFGDCAQVLARTDAQGAQRLAAASTHWLRHTHGTHSVAAGTRLDVLQRHLGHTSLNTTSLYAIAKRRDA